MNVTALRSLVIVKHNRTYHFCLFLDTVVKDQARMGSSSMPGGSTPVSSANMMTGQFISEFFFSFFKVVEVNYSFLFVFLWPDLVPVVT